MLSRREKRYLNRRDKRLAKRKVFLANYDSIENVASFKNLFEAIKNASKNVTFKNSVQKTVLDSLKVCHETREKLLNCEDIHDRFIEFYLRERGKVRWIRAVKFKERIVQKSLCSYILYPVYTHYIIDKNTASQKGKGPSYLLKKLEKDLRDHYRKYGRHGYVLLIDYKDYFGSINHKKLKEICREYFTDKKLLKLLDEFIDAFGEQGIGLGSESSQMHGIFYLNKIDHYITNKLGYKYGRYMDDSYVIYNDKNKLKELIYILQDKLKSYNIKINMKKTHIANITNAILYLKTRFFILKSGKILKLPVRKNVSKERIKLKKQYKLFKENILTTYEIYRSYISWRGSLLYKNCHKTILKTDQLYKGLFS